MSLWKRRSGFGSQAISDAGTLARVAALINGGGGGAKRKPTASKRKGGSPLLFANRWRTGAGTRGTRGNGFRVPANFPQYKIRNTISDVNGEQMNYMENSSSFQMGVRSLDKLLANTSVAQQDVQKSGSGIAGHVRTKQMWSEIMKVSVDNGTENGAGEPGINTEPLVLQVNQPLSPLNTTRNEVPTAHQPIGFDLMATIYKNFVVVGCHYTIQFRNQSLKHVRCWVHTDANSGAILTSTVPTWREALERPDVQTREVGAHSVTATSMDDEMTTFKGYVDMKQYLRGGAGAFGTQMTGTTDGVTQPATIVAVIFQAQDSLGVDLLKNSYEITVQMRYDIIFKDVNGVTES